VRRSMFAAVIAVTSGSPFLCGGASAQWRDLPDGIDNPRPRYYDYHAPQVFYGDSGPVGFGFSEFVTVPYVASPDLAQASPGYGYAGSPQLEPPAVVPIAPRPICGVYRYWRDGLCRDRRGY
jgi:hypothetical protein